MHIEKERIEQRLNDLLAETQDPYNSLFEAARYSILGGGKRFRPLLAIFTAELLGCTLEKILTPACALEMIHTYSLIHDDLPSMDNDDIRRGKPSLHKAYLEGHAILTGDFLLTYAFDVIANAPHLSDKQKVELISVLAKKSGAHGMIGGQVMDIATTGKPIDLPTLKQIHQNKTGALITASVEFGAIAANTSAEKRQALRTFGENIGLAFQIVDDVHDAADDTTSYASLLGTKKSLALAGSLTNEALTILDSLGGSARLSNLVQSLVTPL